MANVPSHIKPQKPLQGILLVLGAVFLFACQDAVGKFLFTTYAVPFVHAVRYFVNLTIMVVVIAPRYGWDIVKTQRPVLVVARGLALALGSLFGGFALRAMPLAETVSILYIAPLAVLFLAMPVLGEKVKWFGWVASGIGFAGLLLIVRPHANISTAGLVFSFLCLLTAVVYPVLSRFLSKTESTETMMFYVGLVGSIFYGVQLPWTMPSVFPPWSDFALMLVLGVGSLIGHSMFTAAYARAPVSLLGPFTYAHIAWATLLGWWFFSQVPDIVTFMGIALVAMAGVGNAVMNYRTSRNTALIFEPQEA